MSNSPHSFNFKSTTVILITTLAEYQTRFWAAIGQELQRHELTVAFISFDDRSTAMLREIGFDTWCLDSVDKPRNLSDATLKETMDRFGIKDFPFWSSHERFNFGIHDPELRRKLMEYLHLAERACTGVSAGGHSAVMIQELGGFLSVIASFHAARRAGMDNWFIEPSFFRGKLFFLKNTFSAPKILHLANKNISSELKNYLTNTINNGEIVVPKKDTHQYNTARYKIFNRKNILRLFQKLSDKYLFGKRQEFGYIKRHVIWHAQMLWNGIRLKRHYTPLKKLNHIVYYPLHVPGDVALTLRSPQYLDQLALIETILRSVPHTHTVAVKEHPAMIGALDAGRLIALKKRYDNLAILPHCTNNYEVIRAADLLISINSKSGAEGILLGKPVIVLGDAFYRHSYLARSLDDLGQLREVINEILKVPSQISRHEEIISYFESVWQSSYPGELYVTDHENVRKFTSSILDVINLR